MSDYTHETLETLFARSVKEGFTLGMLEIALELHANAWGAQLAASQGELRAQLAASQGELRAQLAASQEQARELERTTWLLAGALSTFGGYSGRHPMDVLAEFEKAASEPPGEDVQNE